MKRIFTAIDISVEAKRKVSSYIETLRREFPKLRVGWAKTEKLHLTLKFLGDTEESKTAELSQAIEKIARENPSFKLRILETGIFPSMSKPRILWLALKDERGSLAKINEQLESACEKLGFAPEKRNFKPHLTIARLREPNKSKDLVEKHLNNMFETIEFEASEIIIYESKLQSSGSIYSVVSKHKFNNRTFSKVENSVAKL
ncbi:MAG: RNA 2',3'-cyclic phosphodiesterase [Acidobacteria bacterium]|jgi:2'-5' RNA ligase|nr:RNA 2',3'-cyclic phosphodiesterase [Acidobacteriota bacterium]